MNNQCCHELAYDNVNFVLKQLVTGIGVTRHIGINLVIMGIIFH